MFVEIISCHNQTPKIKTQNCVY